jgi:hypothetical protein
VSCEREDAITVACVVHTAMADPVCDFPLRLYLENSTVKHDSDAIGVQNSRGVNVIHHRDRARLVMAAAVSRQQLAGIDRQTGVRR